MGLTTGSRLGPYEILSALGVGGMGEVYRARDTKLGRDVALKVIPETFALDSDRLARFKREAQVLASLNHPHIGAIYGFEDSGKTHALVLELVAGETLADRIARGPLPLDEALPIARQIAEALEAAHEQGVIHRDLKPANIKITPDGLVKVLDFGLAKLAEPAGSGQPAAGSVPLSMSPTITSPAMMTGVGVILGTAAYMSPEQAKGREADKRCDIWAFGCVLYEMLTGTRPFDGEDVGDTLANVLKIDPDWSALPAAIPPAIRTLLQSCLTKDRRHRVADISTALFVLEKSASLAVPAGTMSVAPLSRRSLWRRIAALAIGVPIVVAVATTLTWIAARPAESVPPRVSRFTFSPSGTAAISINGADRDLAITPDGSRLVYVGNGGTQLFVRALDALEPVGVFTGLPRGPFVSADGEWVGFLDDNQVLKKVAVSGGPAVTLATLDGVSVGATWGADNTIIFATINPPTGLQRVAAAGGPTTVITRPDRAQGEADHFWPELLPGGRAVLFTITAQTGGPDAAQIAVLDLQTLRRTILVRGGSHAHYVPSGPGSLGRDGGYLVYAAAGTLRAVSFDLTTLETRGTPVPVIPAAVMTAAGGVDAAVAGDGTLVYVSGGSSGSGVSAPRTLVWVDRQGRETPVPAPLRSYVFPRLSPDGTRVAVVAGDQEFDLWLWDLERTRLTRATFDPAVDLLPVWTPDGLKLIFSSSRNGAFNLYSQAADGTGAVERLTDSPNLQSATDVSPDGQRLIFTEATSKTGDDVMQIELDGTHRVTPLISSRFAERNGAISPDGRWLAYESGDSGRFEISVRPFPDVNSGHWQVSSSGGTRPLWARSGQELVYVAPNGALMGVGVERASSWAASQPTQLLKEGYFTNPGSPFSGRTYDIAPDGQRFLMVKADGGSGQTAAPASVTVVLNWVEELKRLVPTK